jgi:hypothetical protein
VHEDVAAAQFCFDRRPKLRDVCLRGLIAANGDRGAAAFLDCANGFRAVGDVCMTMFAPCAANLLQKACPIPLAPPVTTARFPVDISAFSPVFVFASSPVSGDRAPIVQKPA